jgi:hypothetical protein
LFASVFKTAHHINDFIVLVHIGQDGVLQRLAKFGGFNAGTRSYKKWDIEFVFELFNRLAQSLMGNKTTTRRLGKTLFFTNAQKIEQLPVIHSLFYGKFRLWSSKFLFNRCKK